MSNSADLERFLPDGDEAGTPPSDRRFRPDVQGLRALAVTLVVLYHAKAPLLTGGFVGVDVFFVISGFVITGVLVRERTATDKTSLRDFYARRARRILPAASLVIVVTVLATYHLQGFLRGDEVAIDGRWAAVFLSNFHEIAVGNDYLGGLGTPSPLLHFWSLAVEEQFYLVFPLLFLVVASLVRLRHRSRALLITVSVVVASSFVWSIIETHLAPVNAFYSPLTRAWELGVGSLVALGGPLLRRIPPMAAAAVTWCGLAAIGLAAIVINATTPFPGAWAAVPVLGCAAVIAGGMATPPMGAEMILKLRPVLFIGAISYSLYLWHFPLLVLAQEQHQRPLRFTERALLILASIVLAWLTAHFLENPIRHSKVLRRAAWRSVVLGLVMIVATLGVLSVLIAAHPGGGSARVAGPASASLATLTRQIEAASQASKAPSSFEPPLVSIPSETLHGPNIPDRCVSIIKELGSDPCVLGDPSAPRTMVLLGDSQAMMWSTSFETLSKNEHWRFVLLGKDGCPPWLTPNLAGSAGEPCTAFHRYSAKVIDALHPSLVVITGAEAPELPASYDAAGLTRLLDELDGHVGRAMVLGTIPWSPAGLKGLSPPECIAEHAENLATCNLSVAAVDATYGDFDRSLTDAADAHGALVAPVRSLFCTTTLCPVIVAHRVVYQDRVHMTWQYASYITPALTTVLARPLLQVPSTDPSGS